MVLMFGRVIRGGTSLGSGLKAQSHKLPFCTLAKIPGWPGPKSSRLGRAFFEDQSRLDDQIKQYFFLSWLARWPALGSEWTKRVRLAQAWLWNCELSPGLKILGSFQHYEESLAIFFFFSRAFGFRQLARARFSINSSALEWIYFFAAKTIE